MKLSYLLQDLPISLSSEQAELEIESIAYDSRAVGPGSLFVAIQGLVVDGHRFIAQAFEQGAVAVVCEKADGKNKDREILVKESRSALAKISARFFGNVSEKMKVIGVTGTNGKTTLTYLLEAIFTQASLSCAVLGTVNYRYPGFEQLASHTTPESYEIESFLNRAYQQKAEVALLEVSSHALDLKRVDGLAFDGAVFTNLSSEHLDYHRNMEEYFKAKTRLFAELLAQSKKKKKFAVLNADDAWVRRIILNSDIAPYRFSLSSETGAEVFPTTADFDLGGIQACVQTPWGVCSFHSPLIGTHNLQNLLAALAVAGACGIDLSVVSQAFSHFKQVPGRLQRVVNTRGVFAFVDYAHTPDALKQVTIALTHLKGKGRLGVVFGCGGDRDKTKRPLMAQEVAQHADFVVVTSDNPRTENPYDIIQQILPGFQKSKWKQEKDFWVEADREKAIAFALNRLQKGDVLLVAGKGHEDYQIIGKEKHHFDDVEVIEKHLEKIA